MYARISKALSALLLVNGMACVAYAQGRSATSDVTAFTQTKDPNVAGSRLREVLKNCEPDILKTHSNKSVAIAAMWRLNDVAMPPEHPFFGASPVVREAVNIHRFLGFLEGKLSVNAPLWWEQVVERPDVYSPNRVRGATIHWTNAPSVPTNVEMGVTLAGSPAAPLQVPNRVLHHLAAGEPGVRLGSVRGVQCGVIASEPGKGTFATVTFLDGVTHRDVWTQQLWGSRDMHLVQGGGPLEHTQYLLDVVIGDDTVTFFGATMSGIVSEEKRRKVYRCVSAEFYVEQFMRSDGSPVARFSSDDWQADLLPALK